jgi:hypothetical protein
MSFSHLSTIVSIPIWRIGMLLFAASGPLQGPGMGGVPTIAAGVDAPRSAAPPLAGARRANFGAAMPSPEARQIADWAMASGDNAGMPFVIIDKVRARLFVFDAGGLLLGTSMVLLGLARGDDQAAGIGTRKLAAIRPEERVTPAGRFVATLGRDLDEDILWVDYADAIALHRVVRGNPGDHRKARLDGLSPLNKRISYGCINVPPKFFDDVVLKAFKGTRGIVYILPEQHKLADVFHISAHGG